MATGAAPGETRVVSLFIRFLDSATVGRSCQAEEDELRTSKIGGVPSLFGRFTRFKTLDLLQSLAAGEFPLEEAGHLFGVGRPHEQVVHAEL